MCLYLVLDLFSRYVVAWMLAHHESGDLAARLFEQAVERHHFEPGHLMVRSDPSQDPRDDILHTPY